MSTANLPASYTSIIIDCELVAKIRSDLMLCVKVLRVLKESVHELKI
jgi:hypothetical protein